MSVVSGLLLRSYHSSIPAYPWPVFRIAYTAWQEDSAIAVVESEIEKEEDPAGFDDDIPEDEHDASAPISFSTLRQETAEVAVEHTSKAARTEEDFDVVILACGAE